MMKEKTPDYLPRNWRNKPLSSKIEMHFTLRHTMPQICAVVLKEMHKHRQNLVECMSAGGSKMFWPQALTNWLNSNQAPQEDTTNEASTLQASKCKIRGEVTSPWFRVCQVSTRNCNKMTSSLVLAITSSTFLIRSKYWQTRWHQGIDKIHLGQKCQGSIIIKLMIRP